MTPEEAHEWLRGLRSWTDVVPQHPLETWMVRVAEADSSSMKEAYWMARAHREGLVPEDIPKPSPMRNIPISEGYPHPEKP